MPSELDTHDILFNPVRKRRAEQAARGTAEKPKLSDRAPVPSHADKDAPPTDRAVAYAIAEADTGPLVSSKLIAGIAVAAAIVTAALLMRTPKLEASAQDETAADDRSWWTAAREQWANETMRVWPIVIRGNRSGAKVTATAIPRPANPPTPSDTSYPGARRAVPSIPAKASDNPYSDSPAPRLNKPAAAGTDNPY
jgi:hypothetical protein